MNKYVKSFTEDKSKMIITQDGTSFHCELERIYAGELGSFYAFTNPMNMPLLRMHQYDKMQQAYSLGYTKTDISNAFAQIEELSKSVGPNKDFEINHIAKSMQERLQDNYSLEEFYLNVTTMMVVSEDEEIATLTSDLAKSKLELWKQAPQILSFFLTIVKTNIISFAKTYESIIQTSTMMKEMTEEQIFFQSKTELPL